MHAGGDLVLQPLSAVKKRNKVFPREELSGPSGELQSQKSRN